MCVRHAFGTISCCQDRRVCVCVCAARMYVAQVLLHVPFYSYEACLSCANSHACPPWWTFIGHTLDTHWTYIGHYIGHWETQGFARLKKTPCFSCDNPFHAIYGFLAFANVQCNVQCMSNVCPLYVHCMSNVSAVSGPRNA